MKAYPLFIRWWWLWLLWVIVCAYPAAWLIGKSGWILFEYESRAVIEVRPVVDIDPTLKEEVRTTDYVPNTSRAFMNHSFGYPVLLPETVSRLLGDSSMLGRLGGDRTGALKQLRSVFEVERIKGTHQLRVSSRYHDPVLAQDLLLALIDSYSKRRMELEQSVREEQLKAIELEIQNNKERGMATSAYEQMKEKYAVEKDRVSSADLVTIVDPPETANYPFGYSPYFLSGLIALPVSGLWGFYLLRLVERLFPRKAAAGKGGSFQLQTDY